MPRPALTSVVVLSSLALAGCHLARPAAPKTRPAPTYTYDTSGVDIDRRAADLQKHGYTKEAARRRAEKEAVAGAWKRDPASSAEAWAYEQARSARSLENERMEKALAKMDRDESLPRE